MGKEPVRCAEMPIERVKHLREMFEAERRRPKKSPEEEAEHLRKHIEFLRRNRESDTEYLVHLPERISRQLRR